MTSSLIPDVDLVPSVASRVVTIDVTDMQEGAPAEGHIDFTLPCDLHVPADDKIIQAGSARVHLVNGQAAIRLPTYDSDARPLDGSEWGVLVQKSWARSAPYMIRVPEGAIPMSLADLPAVRPLTRREQIWAVTGASASVTNGSSWGVSADIRGGILDLDFIVPPGGEAWARGNIVENSDAFTLDPGVYNIPTVSRANSIQNLPEATPGILVVETRWTTAVKSVRYMPYQARHTWETRSSSSSGDLMPWWRTDGGPSGWRHSPLAQNDHLDNLNDPGTYIRFGAADSSNGYPYNVSSGSTAVTVAGDATSTIMTVQYVPATGSGTPREYVRRRISGTWQGWQENFWQKPVLGASQDLNSLTEPGTYVRVGSYSASRGYPESGTGTVEITLSKPEAAIATMAATVITDTYTRTYARRQVDGVWQGWQIPWNDPLLQELLQSGSDLRGFLQQRIGVMVERGDGNTLTGTMPPGVQWDEDTHSGWVWTEATERAFPVEAVATESGRAYRFVTESVGAPDGATLGLRVVWLDGDTELSSDTLVSDAPLGDHQRVDIVSVAPQGATGFRVAAAPSTTEARFRFVAEEVNSDQLNIRDFGAGQGDNRDKELFGRALRAAPCSITFPTGTYMMSGDEDAIYIPAGVSLIGDGTNATTIRIRTGLRPMEGEFSCRGIMFLCPAYSGDYRAIEASYPEGLTKTISNFTIENCEFRNFFYSVYIAGASYDDASDPDFTQEHVIDRVKVSNCYSRTHTSANAGHFQSIWTRDVQYTGNSTVGGNWASSYNFIGGNGLLIVANNYSSYNNHGACEIENRSGEGVITGNTFDAEIWLDDSSDIAVTGNRVKGKIRLTTQWYPLRDISVSGNVCSAVEVARFSSGTQRADQISGGINITGNVIRGDGTTYSENGVTVRDDFGRLRDVTIANNTLTGTFLNVAMLVEHHNTEMTVTIFGNNLAQANRKTIDCPVVGVAGRVYRAYNLGAVYSGTSEPYPVG